MVTRIRIEAEGRSPQEVEQILYTAHEVFTQRADRSELEKMFRADTDTPGVGNSLEGLADAQAGELVIERFANRDSGAIVFRGRMTSHFAKPAVVRKLAERSPLDPYVQG